MTHTRRRFYLSVDLENDALQDLGELARILRHAADWSESSEVGPDEPAVTGFGASLRLHDVNGNAVGIARFQRVRVR